MFRMLKRNAKLALRGNWSSAVLVALTMILVTSGLAAFEQFALWKFVVDPLQANPTMDPAVLGYGEFLRALFTYRPVEIGITVGFSLLSILLVAPLGLGVTWWHYRLVCEENPAYSECFHFFESWRLYWRSVWHFIQITVRTFLWSIPFFLLPGALLGVSLWYLPGPDTAGGARATAATMGVSLSVALFLLAAVLYLLFIHRYALSGYYLCAEEELSARDAIRRSVHGSRGYRASLLLFRLSFVGWFFLLPFTLFFLLLWLVPYFDAAGALYARYIIEKDRSRSEDTEERTREFRPDADPDRESEPGTPDSPGSAGSPNLGRPEPDDAGFGADRSATRVIPSASTVSPATNVPAESAPTPRFDLSAPAAGTSTAEPQLPAAQPGRVPPPWEADRPVTPAPRATAIPWPQGESPLPGGAAAPERPEAPTPPARPAADPPPARDAGVPLPTPQEPRLPGADTHARPAPPVSPGPGTGAVSEPDPGPLSPGPIPPTGPASGGPGPDFGI